MSESTVLVLDHPAILRANARAHYWEGIGTLSTKMRLHQGRTSKVLCGKCTKCEICDIFADLTPI